MAALCGTLLPSLSTAQNPPPLEPPSLSSPSLTNTVAPDQTQPTPTPASPDEIKAPSTSSDAIPGPVDDSLPRFAALPPSDD